MSKPYFAKYLPVEGEIKEGDMKYCSNTDTILPCHKLEHLCKDCKKVVLSLCSRDISVGDEMFSHVEVGEPPYPIIKGICVDYEHSDDTYTYRSIESAYERTNVGASFCFKQIGEISLDAKWVKEGDEFNNNEVKFMEFIAMMGSSEVNYERFMQKKGDYNYISLLGPCGHFH